MPPRRVNEIVHGTRRVSADAALRLARYFGTFERFWLNLQARDDLEAERDRLGDTLDQIRPVPWRNVHRLLDHGQGQPRRAERTSEAHQPPIPRLTASTLSRWHSKQALRARSIGTSPMTYAAGSNAASSDRARGCPRKLS